LRRARTHGGDSSIEVSKRQKVYLYRSQYQCVTRASGHSRAHPALLIIHRVGSNRKNNCPSHRLAPCSSHHLFTSGMRVEYIKIIVRSIFRQGQHVTGFSVILDDCKAILVITSSINFTNTLLQETQLRNTRCVIFIEDIDKYKTVTAAQAFGFRCKIALRKSRFESCLNRVVAPSGPELPSRSLQMRLSWESTRCDPRVTVWRNIGTLKPISRFQIAPLCKCVVAGGFFAQLSLYEGKYIAIVGIAMSGVFCGVYTCCSQCQLLKRVTSSLPFLFYELQVLAAGICLMDTFS
ncbi:hypothetical protein GN958_ATG02210, partial [Phytophthora infestans]